MTPPLIEVSGLSKKFCRSLKRSLWYGLNDLGTELAGRNAPRSTLRKGEFWAIKDLSVDLRPGETLGLVGPNGAGKTTLLRILNGLIKPDEGRVTVRGRMQALIALGTGFNPILTGRENVYVNASILGIPRADVDKRFDAIVDFAGIPEFIDSPVQSYSSGMAVRLGFAVAAHLDPDILLVDEVLAVGDEGFQIKCLNRIGELRAGGTGIILVSHNMHTVSTYSDRVLLKTSKSHTLYSDVSEGIRAYKQLVHAGMTSEIEKHCSGAPGLNFHNVEIPTTDLDLGSTFRVRLHYSSDAQLDDVEIDLLLLLSGGIGPHFQATNRTFGDRVTIEKGDGWIDVSVEDLRIIHENGRFSIAVWAQGRTSLLFWWRIPVRFTATMRSSGSNVYRTVFNSSSLDAGAARGPRSSDLEARSTISPGGP